MKDKEMLAHFLEERIKELNCLYQITALLEQCEGSLDTFLQGVADLLPSSWQYPEITRSRVVLHYKPYACRDFKPGKWHQAAPVRINGKICGMVEVHYIRPMPQADEGPFLKEERRLIDAVANQIGREVERFNLESFLRERIKELTCLYNVSNIIETHSKSLDTILQKIVNLLPESWQYPDISCSRIRLNIKDFVTPRFTVSDWRQAADIIVGEKKVGCIEVYYREKMPEVYEGPFLKEERLLIDAVADHIGRAIHRIRMSQQLEVEKSALDRKNIALHELLEKVREEKKDLKMNIQANMDKVIMPILSALKEEIPPEQKGYMELLRKNLADLTSPFTDRLSKKFSKLTPVEIQICHFIKYGFSSKEIAARRHVAVATVHRHRENIRKKLGLTAEKVNLSTYLGSFMTES